jgi:hypothetical protein
VPVVLTVHDVSFCAHPEWFSWREGTRRRTITGVAARRAARVLTVSQFSKDEIVRLEKEIATLDQTLAAPDLYAGKPAELAGFAKRRAETVKHLAAIEENWLGLNAEYEKSQAV